MFDIRKIQENIIYEAVRAESNEDIANEVVYGKDNMSKAENNSDWVKSSMIRLENNFETETIKKIRMNCQCGYEMDEKIALVMELKSDSSNIEDISCRNWFRII